MASRLPSPAEAQFAVRQSLRSDDRVFRRILAGGQTVRTLVEKGLLDNGVRPTPEGLSYIVEARVQDDRRVILKILVGTVIDLEVT